MPNQKIMKTTSHLPSATSAINSYHEKYEQRLKGIMEGLLQIEVGRFGIWKHWWIILRSLSVDSWMQKISQIMTPECKDLLSSDSAPKLEDFSRLSYFETSNPGVYFSVIREADQQRPFFVYVGSATSPIGGLQQRIHQHKSLKYSKYQV